VLRVHRIPFSTNVQRVAIAAGLKGLEVEWVDHDPADRGAIRALSGQDLFPVAELPDGRLLHDSPVILRALDELAPDPPLWPAEPTARATADVFAEWFNLVWKGPPNRIADGAEQPGDRAWLAASRDVFEGLLAARPFLLGDEPGIADVLAYPFLRYGRGVQPGDDDAFHAVLAAHLDPQGHPRLDAWLDRCAATFDRL
jgi:maleylacetoacetate isomerase/maleylpyruvate isomerase